MRMLFIDYSSAFNTIVPSKLITKLRTPILIEGVVVEQVESVKFLGIHILCVHIIGLVNL